MCFAYPTTHACGHTTHNFEECPSKSRGLQCSMGRTATLALPRSSEEACDQCEDGEYNVRRERERGRRRNLDVRRELSE